MTEPPFLPHDLGRYQLSHEIAAGGMATVHLGRLVGPVGFARTVAIKRLHPHYAKDPEFVSMFLDEARLAARIRHPNVVSTLDVVASRGQLYLVMDYVQGAPLSQLIESARAHNSPIPPAIATAIVVQTLLGLHAAHEARGDDGRLLEVVHRDLSPHNILVGEDGVARVADFGVAKAAARTQTTHRGQIKGKLSYMSPEQLMARPIDRRTDIFAAGTVLWECLTTEKLFAGADTPAIMAAIIGWQPGQLAVVGNEVTDTVLKVLWRSLAHEPPGRYSSALEMARELSSILTPADGLAVADWVRQIIPEFFEQRSRLVAEFESGSRDAALSSGSAKSAPRGVEVVVPAESILTQVPTEAPTRVDLPAARSATQGTDTGLVPVRKYRRPLWLITGMTLATVAAVLWWLRHRLPSGGGQLIAVPSSLSASDETGPNSTAYLPTQAYSVPPPAAQHREAEPADASAPDSRPRTPGHGIRSGRQTTRAGSSRRHSQTKNAAVPSPSNCDPPYTVRPDGLKAYKLECL